MRGARRCATYLIFEIFDVDSDGVIGSGEVAKANEVILKSANPEKFLMK